MILVLICGLTILVSCKKKDEPLELSTSSVAAEYGESIHFEKFLKNGGYSSFEVKGYDSMKLGKQTVTLIAVYDDVTHSGKMIVEIKDTHAPTIKILGDGKFEINVGDSIDLKKYAEASDPVDGKLELVLLTNIDTNKPGIYTVKVESTDKNGLSTSATFLLTVKEKKPVVEDPTPPVQEIETPDSNTDSGGGSNTTWEEPEDSSGGYEPEPEQPSPPINEKPGNRSFMFADGYDMNTANDACIAYITNASSLGYGGSCIPQKNDNGIYTGILAIIH